MNKSCGFLLAMVLLICLACTAMASELDVSPEGHGDYTTLTEAVAAAQPGDTLHLMAGVYASPAESYPVVIDKPLTIKGEEGVILDSPAFATLLQITSDDVTLTGIDFQVRKWGIVAQQSRRLTLENCTFILVDEAYRTSSTAVWMEAMKDCSIVNCTFAGVGVCVAGDPLSESSSGKAVLTGLCEVGEDEDYFLSHRIENCTVNGKPLYYIPGGKDVVVPSDAGGIIAAYCDGITVKDADVSDSSMGLEIVHSKNVELDHVTADRCGIFGTYVAFAEGGSFCNVTVHDTNHGIDTRASKDVTVDNCMAENCDQGIFFSLCTDTIMRNCDVTDCGFGCFTAVGRGLQISDCCFDGNADGIYLQNERETTITNCNIAASTVVGLRVLKSTGICEDTKITNNWTGVIIYDSQDVILHSCILAGNQSAGIYAGETRNTQITSCSISGDTKAHFEFDGTFENTVVSDCTLTGDMTTMLRLKSGNMPVFMDNTWI